MPFSARLASKATVVEGRGISQLQLCSPASWTLQPRDMDKQSRELLHHYTTTVYETMAANTHLDIWKSEIPRLGLAHPFLMHGTLAISALHLSRMAPSRSREFRALAIQEEHKALPSFRSALAKCDPMYIHAVFAFSGNVIPYILASSTTDTCIAARLPAKDDNHPHWFLALRGFQPLVVNNWMALRQGPFAALLVPPQTMARNHTDNPDDTQLALLEDMFSLPTTTSAPTSERLVYAEALAALRHVFHLPSSPRGAWLDVRAAVYIWPVAISQSYVDLLYKKTPQSLVLFAYYCVLLKRINSCWYFKGLGEALLVTIERELDPEWHPWIVWPLQQSVR
ncbi:hypothetical protein B0O99DRAFT_214171 [Bisporella sp. PMI_857]|nr:hypothetical protein B0O99DRAFT_214171 [Bisporella sp. PMI_857]